MNDAHIGEMNPQIYQLSFATIASCFLLTACTDDAGSMDGADSVDSMNSTDDSSDTSDTADTIGDPGTPVELGEAGEFAILAKSGVSTVPASAVTGDVGLSPAAATYPTGFSLTMDGTNVFATSPQVTGSVYASDYAPPTPSDLGVAISDMELAFTDAAGRAPDVTELGAGNISGMTLEPGVYAWGTSLGISTDVWLGGARPENIFWQVAGLVDFGTTAHAEGIVLTQTSITLRTGASIDGRLLAQTSVDLDASIVVEP